MQKILSLAAGTVCFLISISGFCELVEFKGCGQHVGITLESEDIIAIMQVQECTSIWLKGGPNRPFTVSGTPEQIKQKIRASRSHGSSSPAYQGAPAPRLDYSGETGFSKE